MKIFVTGASGYIGFNVASTLRRAGHEVWGLVRTEEKGKVLARHEIRPVIGTMQNPSEYLAIMAACSVLIHAAADAQVDMFAIDQRMVQTMLEVRERGPTPKTLIYASGVWLYGNTGGKAVNETVQVHPPKLVAPRSHIEQQVLNASGLRTLVIRAGCVYGKQGGLPSMWFKDAHEHRILTVVGDGQNCWAMVHVDDLAEGYLRAAESDLSGEILNLVDQSHLPVREMIMAVARVAGNAAEPRSIPPANAAQIMGTDFVECLLLDQYVDAAKARRLLGWAPRHPSFVDEVETYFRAWKAYQD